MIRDVRTIANPLYRILRASAYLAIIGWAICISEAPAAAQSATSVPASDPDISRIVSYLNGIRTLQGRFVQIAPDGNVTQGDVFLRRPGRMRFKYDPPTPVLIVADGVWLVLWDKELDQVDRVPLSSTPLAFLIRDKVSFADPIVIRKVDRQPGLLKVTVFDKRRDDEGEITLIFSDQPLALRQWVVTDPQLLQTRVSLYDIETNIPLDIKLFVFTDSGPSLP